MFANEKAKKGTTTPSTYLNPTAIAADDAAGTLTIATDPAQYVDVPAALAARARAAEERGEEIWIWKWE